MSLIREHGKIIDHISTHLVKLTADGTYDLETVVDDMETYRRHEGMLFHRLFAITMAVEY